MLHLHCDVADPHLILGGASAVLGIAMTLAAARGRSFSGRAVVGVAAVALSIALLRSGSPRGCVGLQLPISAGNLGVGWRAIDKVESDVLGACLHAGDDRLRSSQMSGPGFTRGRDGSEGRLTSTVFDLGDTEAAVDSVSSVRRTDMQHCFERGAASFGLARPIHWDTFTKLDGASVWTGSMQVSARQATASIFLAVVPRGSTVVGIQLLSSDSVGTSAAGARVVRALADGG